MIWWVGVITIGALSLLGALVMLDVARAAWFAAIFARRAVAGLGWAEGLPNWRKPISFIGLVWRWTWDAPDIVRGANGAVVHHPRLKRADFNEDDRQEQD